MTKHTIIAIDGPAASGKGTLARALAEKLGFSYLDTGILYRLVGSMALNGGLRPDNADEALIAAQSVSALISGMNMADPFLRTDFVAQAASQVAAHPKVREELLTIQRNFAKTVQTGNFGPYGSGVVMDGRDIGTIVAPNADIKFFVTASVEERADRRLKELSGKNIETTYENVLADMKRRDERDTQRDTAPLKPADDAIILDTSAMSASDALAEALKVVSGKLG